jgi:hypothetical protein
MTVAEIQAMATTATPRVSKAAPPPLTMSSQLDYLRPRTLAGLHTEDPPAPFQTRAVANDNETDGSRHALKASVDISISLQLEAAVRQMEEEGAACTSGIQPGPATSKNMRPMAVSLRERKLS